MPGRTTVAGVVSAGPTSPVERPGQPNTAPVATGQVVARAADGAVAARTSIATGGSYRLELPPGRYTLIAEGTGSMRCTPVDADVSASDRPIKIDLTCDTGIR